MRKNVVRASLLALALLGMVGCAKLTEPFNDAPVKNKDDSPAEVYSMPDGFNNFSTKCDRHGNRVYVLYHGNESYGGISVVPADPSCDKQE